MSADVELTQNMHSMSTPALGGSQENGSVETNLHLNFLIEKFSDHFLRTLNSNKLETAENGFRAKELDKQNFINLIAGLIAVPDEHDRLPSGMLSYVKQCTAQRMYQDLEVQLPKNVSSVTWLKFLEFIICKSENLRQQGTEHESKKLHPISHLLQYRPMNVKACFSKAYYWPQIDVMLLFECGPQHSLSGDRGIRIHRPMSRRRKYVMQGHTKDLLSAEYIPRLNVVVTVGNDQVVNFWHGDTFTVLKRFHNISVSELCWADDIDVLYAADHFGERIFAFKLPSSHIGFRDFNHLKSDKIHELPGQNGCVQKMKWINHMHTLVTCSLSPTILLWDTIGMDKTPKMELVGHKKGITSIEYSHYMRLLCTSGYEPTIFLWDPNAGTRVGVLEGHSVNIVAATILPSSYEFASVDMDGVLRMWDLRHMKCIQVESANEGCPGETESVLEPRAMVTIGNRLVITGQQISIFALDVPDYTLTAEVPVAQVVASACEIIVPHPPSGIRVWDIYTGTIKSVAAVDVKGSVTALAMDRNNRRILVGSESGEMVVLNYGCLAQTLKRLAPHAVEVTQVSFIEDKIVTCATDKVIVIHDDIDPRQSSVLKIVVPPAYLGNITRIAVNADRNLISCVTGEGFVFWYNTMSVKFEAVPTETQPPAHASACSHVDFFSDRPLMVTGDVDGKLIFYTLKPLPPYAIFHETQASEQLTGLSSFVLGPNGKSIICAVESTLVLLDTTAIIDCIDSLTEKKAKAMTRALTSADFEQDTNSPELPAELPVLWTIPSAHNGNIEYLQSLGRLFLSLGSDCLVRIWDWESGESLGKLASVREPGDEWKFKSDAPAGGNDKKSLFPSNLAAGVVSGFIAKASGQKILTKRKVKTPKKIVESQSLRSLGSEKTILPPRLEAHRRAGGFDLYDTGESFMKEPKEPKRVYLPPLDSGLKRQPRFDGKCKSAAQRLSKALLSLGDERLAEEFSTFSAF